MKMNAEKCHLSISGKTFKQMRVRIRGDMMWENRTAKLLGTTIDNELKFDEHLTNSKQKTANCDKNEKIFGFQ